MRRIQFVFVLLSAVIAATVLLEAQLWVAGTSSTSTSGTVSITNGTTSALAVTGGADIGGVIQAGSSNVNVTNAAGNLLPAALAAGTISTSQTFTAPITLQASTAHIFTAPSGLTLAQWRGRVSDNAGSLQFVNNAGSTEFARLTWTSTPALTISGGAGGATGIIVGASDVSWAGLRLNSSPVQPGFLATKTSTQSINGADTVTFTEVYDDASNYASSIFTVPVDGRYLVCSNLTYQNSGSSTSLFAVIDTSISSTVLKVAQTNLLAVNEILTFGSCVIAPLVATETLAVVLTTTGGTGGQVNDGNFSVRLVP